MGIKDLKKSFAELVDKQVKVGWLEGNVYPDSGVPVAFVAFINEFGGTRTLKNGKTIRIPARAPLRTTMDQHGNEIADTLRKCIKKGMDQGEVIQYLNQFGLFVQGTIQDTIESKLPPGNAEATINGMVLRTDAQGHEIRAGSSPAKENRTFGQGKGFDAPLVDSGRLVKTVTYTVEEAE